MADGGKSPEDIGLRLTALREAMGLNQAAFAKLVGFSQPALANYEKGYRRPNTDQAIQIVTRTGITLDWLYLGERAGLSQRLLALIGDFESRQRKAG